MSNWDEDKKKQENATSGSSRGFPPNFGDDDDFVVPDHIQDIINEVHNSQSSSETADVQPGQSHSVAQESTEQHKIVAFDDDSEHNFHKQEANPDVFGLVGEVLPPKKEEPVIPQVQPPWQYEDRSANQVSPPQSRHDFPEGHHLPDHLKSQNHNPVQENRVPEPPPVQHQEPPRNYPDSWSLEDLKTPEPPKEIHHEPPPPAPQNQWRDDSEIPDLSFSSLPPVPKKSESIFDKPPEEKHADPAPKIKLPKKKSLRPLKKIMAVLLVGIIGGSGLFYGYQYYSKQMVDSKKVLGAASPAVTVQDAVKRIAEIVDLAEGEQPSEVATIDDTSKLTNNAFFDRAKNGDMVLVYPASKVAVLFRMTNNKVIAIGPVDTTTPQPTVSPTPIPSEDELANPTPSVSPTIAPAAKTSSSSAATKAE